jgi:hypothetical protein
MTDGLNGIIKQLERQQRAIERAVAALRDVEETPAPALEASAPGASTGTRKKFSAASRRKMALAQKARWAAKKAAANAPVTSPQKAAPRKVLITPEGRKRLAEAMKRRWAVKRAASAVKKTARKKRAAKKAA